MPLKILHTADWHIGQMFYDYDRTAEHTHFLQWLTATIQAQKVDVLLVSGDVFDTSNPSAVAMSLFYEFLDKCTLQNPDLQIVITAGNHDSASRLQAPHALLSRFRTSIVGHVVRDSEGKIDFDKLLIPLQDSHRRTQAWCLAVPYLRVGDYPSHSPKSTNYAADVADVYTQAYEFALSRRASGQAIVAMGHLHTTDAQVLTDDKSERLIMGGVECVSAAAFDTGLAYTALGHIHKAQKIAGRDNVRYSGSPLPMSFSEINYKHQVLIVELEGEKCTNIQPLEIPVLVELKRVPQQYEPLPDVLEKLAALPDKTDENIAFPYLEIRVRLDAPEPALRHKIEMALANKAVRLARIDARTQSISTQNNLAISSFDELKNLQPQILFEKIYQKNYDQLPPAEITTLFEQVYKEINEIQA